MFCVEYLSMRWVILRLWMSGDDQTCAPWYSSPFLSLQLKMGYLWPNKKDMHSVFLSFFFLYNLDVKISNLLGKKMITGLSSTNLQKLMYQNTEQRQPQPLFTFLMPKTSLGILRTGPSPESKEWTVDIKSKPRNWNPIAFALMGPLPTACFPLAQQRNKHEEKAHVSLFWSQKRMSQTSDGALKGSTTTDPKRYAL